MEPFNYFEILGLDSKATLAQIKKAYRKLVFKYHPDHNSSKVGRKNFSRITKAYKVLADPVKKDEYIEGQSISVTDQPWIVLENYWELILKKSFN